MSPITVVIVGAYGSAGVAAAEALAEEPDIELVLVDDGDPGGGLCILRGCMPSKEVLSAGAHRFQARHDHRLADPPSVDLEAVVEMKDEHVMDFAAHRRAAVAKLADCKGVSFHHDTARFLDEHTIAVGDREVEADYVILATGSTPSIPDVPGIDDVETHTSADVLDATEFGDSGVVMGFGVVGLELAPYLAEAAGMDLTVIEHDARPLDGADDVFGDAVLDLYREAFDLRIPTGTDEQRVEPTDGGVRLTIEHGDSTEEAIEADQLFTFTGRRPALSGLGIDRTPIDPRPGWVRDTMQTVALDHVFVAGDANGREPVLHVAKEEGQVAASNVLAHVRGEPLVDYENTHHRVIFSGLGVYPFARVGHTAETAREADHDVIVATREAADDGVFMTKDVPEGLARMVVDADDGTVLGYQGLHYHADVMAKTMQVVVERGMDVRAVPDRAYHPTTPEIIDGCLRSASAQL